MTNQDFNKDVHSMISVVIPVYRAEEMLVDLVDELKKYLPESFEIILVNDCSPDRSWDVIQKIGDSDQRVKGINLSKNFGQHPAIFAGLSVSKGDHVIVMDCDFQDDPKYIPVLIQELNKGFDLVLAKRIERKEVFTKRVLNSLFYKSLSYFTDLDFDGSIGNYGVYSRKVIDSVLSVTEYFKVFSFTVRWLGFNASSIEVKHGVRKSGETSYTFKSLFRMAENIILTFSNKPLILTIRFGMFLSLSSIVTASVYLFLFYKPDFSLINGLILFSSWFLSGLILFSLGLAGLYIGKIFEAQKNRPYFVISEKRNIE